MSSFSATLGSKSALKTSPRRLSVHPRRLVVKASTAVTPFNDELIANAKKLTASGKGLLAMDESNATCGKRLDSIGLENTEDNRKAYRTILVGTPGLGEYISGAILFEETLY